MKAREVKIGRTFGVAFEHDDDFMSSLARSCQEDDVQQGYIQMFIEGFAEAGTVGTCDKLDDPRAPVWSKVCVSNVEALGCGAIVRGEAGGILPHIHAAVGLKDASRSTQRPRAPATCCPRRSSSSPRCSSSRWSPRMMTRPRNLDLYDVPLLTFD